MSSIIVEPPTFVSRESVTVSKRVLDDLSSRLGVDNGGTLSKILYVTNDPCDADKCFLNFVTVPKTDFPAAVRWIRAHQLTDGCQLTAESPAVVKLTGVNSACQDLFKEVFNATTEHVIELLTQVRGCHWMVTNLTEEQAFMADEQPDPLYKMDVENELLAKLAEKFNVEGADAADVKFPALMANMGSGSAICAMDAEGKLSSLHFDMLSGKVFQGLGSLLVGTSSYDEILSMAERGDRANVDLLIKEFIADDPTSPYGRFNGDIPMMHFGKAAEGRLAGGTARKEDVARSLVSLFCANLLGSLISISSLAKIPRVYFGGNVFRHPIFRREFENIKCMLMPPPGGFRHRFLRNGGHIGAVGALVATNMDAPVYLKFA